MDRNRTIMMLCSKKSIDGIGVELSQASLTLGGRLVLNNVNFSIRSPEAWVIRGANGAGKTQLLRLLVGERWPDADHRSSRLYRDARGHELVLSQIRSRLLWVGGEAMDRYERYQWNFTVKRVIESGVGRSVRPLARPSKAQAEWVGVVLRAFGLWSLRARRILDLSYGQRRWVLLARAFASDSGLVALDEIYNGLDASLRAALNRLLPQWQARGATIVMALHQVDPSPSCVHREARVENAQVKIVDPGHRRAGLGARRARPTRTARASATGETITPLVTLQNAWIYRGYKPVIQNLNVRINEGQHCLVLGSNGSGKSTLLEAILGQVPIAYGGHIVRHELKANAPLRSWVARVGHVSPLLQAETFYGSRVIDVLVSAKRINESPEAPVTAAEIRQARRIFKSLSLPVDLESPHWRLSYGQRRLLLVARALMQKPRILLLDEPFTGLDQAFRAHLKSILEALMHQHTTMILSVHHPHEAPDGFVSIINLDEVSVAPKIEPIGF